MRNRLVVIAGMLSLLSLSLWGQTKSSKNAPANRETDSLSTAVADTQRTFASDLDAELPKVPFADWFRRIVGPDAGIVWQLGECGE